MEELVHLRGQSSKTFILGDDKFRTEIGTYSHVLKNGLYIPVVNTLDPESGLDPETGFDYTVSNHSSAHSFQFKFGVNPVYFKMRVVDTGEWCVLEPHETNANPDYTIVGNIITIVNVWDGIDMIVTVFDLGIKICYRITSADGQRIIQIGMNQSATYFSLGTPWYRDQNRSIHVVPMIVNATTVRLNFTQVPLGTIIDPTVTLQPAHPSGENVQLVENLPEMNLSGTGFSLLATGAGNAGISEIYARAMIRLSVSSITGPVTVSDASLDLNAHTGIGATTDVDLHRILRNWVEAETTWRYYATATDWAEFGAFGSGDSEPTRSGFYADDNTVGRVLFTGAGLLSDVESWINGTAVNNGWLIKQATNEGNITIGKSYDGSGDATEADRPQLNITYSTGSAAAARRYMVGPSHQGGAGVVRAGTGSSKRGARL